jgi:hypothetical protein
VIPFLSFDVWTALFRTLRALAAFARGPSLTSEMAERDTKTAPSKSGLHRISFLCHFVPVASCPLCFGGFVQGVISCNVVPGDHIASCAPDEYHAVEEWIGLCFLFQPLVSLRVFAS